MPCLPPWPCWVSSQPSPYPTNTTTTTNPQTQNTSTNPSSNTSLSPSSSTFEVLRTNVSVSYDTECMVLGHTCPTIAWNATRASASSLTGVELISYQGTKYYAGNFGGGPYGPGTTVSGQYVFPSHDVWFANSTIFCMSPSYGNYAACPLSVTLPSVRW